MINRSTNVLPLHIYHQEDSLKNNLNYIFYAAGANEHMITVAHGQSQPQRRRKSVVDLWGMRREMEGGNGV